MDGRERALTHSLQFRLAAALSAVVIALALGAGAFSFWTAFQEANELQDDQLREMAAVVDAQSVPASAGQPVSGERIGDPDSRFVVEVTGLPPGQHRADAAGALNLPPALAEGLQTLAVGTEAWRLFVRPAGEGVNVVVGQRIEARDEIARHGALRTVLPLLALVPVLLLLVVVVVRRAVRPVVALAREIDQRNENDLTSLPDQQVPNEIRPFIASINRLLERVNRAMHGQRRFVADAAHELRTPLTVLLLQAEALAGKELPSGAQGRVASLRQGIERVRSLLEQLLTLARFEAEARSDTPPVPISALQALRTVIEEQLPMAEAKHIDLGAVGGEIDAFVAVGAVELHALLRNLVDNAVRYTPPGGRVDVSLHTKDGAATIEVVDSGPGIPAGERERVFDPFYRLLGVESEGSGLGLSIVKTLAARMGATVTLTGGEEGAGPALADADAASLGGLRVIVSLRAAAPVTAPSRAATTVG